MDRADAQRQHGILQARWSCRHRRARGAHVGRGRTAEGRTSLMHPFEYAQPTTKEQAAALLGSNWNDAAILAGGTDLMSQMKDNLTAPKRVVDIKGIQEFS